MQNRKRLLLSLLVSMFVLAGLNASAMASDEKIYTADMCVASGTIQSVLKHSNDNVYNDHSDFITVYCPIVKEFQKIKPPTCKKKNHYKKILPDFWEELFWGIP